MNRYLVFKGNHYYPSGGWDDLFGSFEFLDEATKAAEVDEWEWSHVVDSLTWERLFETRRDD